MRNAVRISACLLTSLIVAIRFIASVAADPDPSSLVGQWVGFHGAASDPNSAATGMLSLTIRTVEKGWHVSGDVPLRLCNGM
jgi:hypothetical protein